MQLRVWEARHTQMQQRIWENARWLVFLNERNLFSEDSKHSCLSSQTHATENTIKHPTSAPPPPLYTLPSKPIVEWTERTPKPVVFEACACTARNKQKDRWENKTNKGRYMKLTDSERTPGEWSSMHIAFKTHGGVEGTTLKPVAIQASVVAARDRLKKKDMKRGRNK